MKKIIFLFIFLSFFLKAEISIKISLPEKEFQQEQEIMIKVEILNKSKNIEKIEFQYLQPKEKNCLFVGNIFKLDVLANGEKIENFTNHMPPEPKPGMLNIEIKKGEKFSCFLPFTYYYYPVSLPAEFSVKLKYKNSVSNTLSFKVYPTKGKKEDNSIVVNGKFKEGEDFPYGWKNTFKEVKWDKKNGIISFKLNKMQAFGEGMWVYSIFSPIKTPEKYILKLEVKSENPDVIVFVEGWGIVRGRKRRLERNECFVHPDNEWKEYNFNVIFNNEKVKWFRIKLYSYLKPGKVYFKNIQIFKRGK